MEKTYLDQDIVCKACGHLTGLIPCSQCGHKNPKKADPKISKLLRQIESLKNEARKLRR